jgi:hypothetical protein
MKPPPPAFANQVIALWSTTMFASASPEIHEAAAVAANALSKFETARAEVVEKIQAIAQQTAAGMEVGWAASEDGKREAEAFIEESAAGRNAFADLYANVLADFMIGQARGQLA